MGMTARISIDYEWSTNQMESRLAMLFRGRFVKRAGQRFSFTFLQVCISVPVGACLTLHLQFPCYSSTSFMHVCVWWYVYFLVCHGLWVAIRPRHSCRGLDWWAGTQDLWTWCFVHPQPTGLPTGKPQVLLQFWFKEVVGGSTLIHTFKCINKNKVIEPPTVLCQLHKSALRRICKMPFIQCISCAITPESLSFVF